MCVAAIPSAMQWWIFIRIAHRLLRQAVDDPAFPQRAVTIEAPLHDLGDPPEQRRVIAGTRQCGAPYVMGDVEVGVVHPLRCAEIERLRAQDLPEPRHRQNAFGQAGDERVEVGHRSGEDGEGTDREADVAVGVLGFEESRIKRCQVLHDNTVNLR